jgi:hypothetical protein
MKDAHDLAASIAAGAVTHMERAAILVMAAEGDHHLANYNAALASQIAKAERVDAAFAELQNAIAEHDAAASYTMVACNAVHQHNQSVLAAVASNALLAGKEPADRPRARPPAHVTLKPVRVAYLENGWGQDGAVKPYSVAERIRSLHGLPQSARSRT